MPALTATFWIPLALVFAVPLAAVVLVSMLVRASRRSHRCRARARASELFRLLSGSVSGQVAERELRRAAASAQHDSFWDALEAIAATLRTRERRELAGALKRSGHLAHERRVLASK